MPGGREDFLLKFYYSNTRGVSLKGQRHASCFYGSSGDVAREFFEYAKIRNLLNERAEVKASTDGRMLGVAFNHEQKGRLTFRLSHCNSGKSNFSETKISNWLNGKNDSLIKASAKRSVASATSSAFSISDTMNAASDIPQFKLRADFDNAPKSNETKPWAGLDLRNQKQALKFTLLVQKYFYENMANQNPNNPDQNFIAQNNQNRYWCHMPWLHVGFAGREAAHGMTKERDLVPSTLIPVYKNTTPGSNWGVAYFNANGCQAIQNVFGTANNPKREPDFNNGEFADGTVITKMLFTTANFPEIKNAYTWRANVSDPGSTDRQIKTVRHIQMDIAVKDLSLKGTIPGLNYWVMAGFYYDPDYDFEKELRNVLGEENPLKSIPNLPKELLKMRPIGVQTGFDSPETGDTVIFPGAYANGSKGRLNGPADNPKTSCLGCHGAAGTTAKMIPGFLSMRMFTPHEKNLQLDFNQQFALAKENYETNFDP